MLSARDISLYVNTQLSLKVQRCVERCSGPAQRAQQFVQSELEQFQSSLGRCVQMCQDDIKDKVTALSHDL